MPYIAKRPQQLDINTKKGQESLRHEREMLERIEGSMKVKLVETDKDKDAKCDGVIIHNDKIGGIFESKCRNMNYMELLKHGSWLITLQKILDGQTLSKMLRVPFLGFLYLIPDQMIFYWKITDNMGDFNFGFDVRRTSTQRTINGGRALRTNAYLPMDRSTEII